MLLVVGAVSLVTFALHGLTGTLSRDLSVYTYAGQQVVDGHPPYLGILNRAGPLAHLAPALGVGIARIVGIDDLVGARLLFMAISVLCVCTAYLLGRDLFGSPLVGLVTAATFLSFQGFIEYASNGPREKTLMMLFILLALWAMVHRRWFAAGLCVSLATLTLQIGFFAAAPAVLVALLLAPGEGGRIRALAPFRRRRADPGARLLGLLRPRRRAQGRGRRVSRAQLPLLHLQSADRPHREPRQRS